MSLTEELIADLGDLDNEEFESSSEDEDGQQQDGDVTMEGQAEEEDDEDGFVEPDFEALQSKDITKIAKLYNGKGFQETLKVPSPLISSSFLGVSPFFFF